MPKGKEVNQGGPWPPKRKYAVAVNAERLKGNLPARYKKKKKTYRKRSGGRRKTR